MYFDKLPAGGIGHIHIHVGPAVVVIVEIQTNLAIDEPDALAMASAMLCQSYHLIGDQAKAEAHHYLALQYAPLHRRINSIRFGIDQRVRSMSAASRLQFLLGRPGQAAAVARKVLDFALKSGDPIGIVMAAYTASKSFSRIFTEALWAECAPLGVDVLHLNIGFTA